MKPHRALVVFFIFLIASSSFAYDVVLKNGKILHGKVVSDDQNDQSPDPKGFFRDSSEDSIRPN